MMPNVWFCKLKDMTIPKNHNNTFPIKKKEEYIHHSPRKSYYFTRELYPGGDRLCNSSPSNPRDQDIISTYSLRKSAKQRIRRNRPANSSSKLVSNSVSEGFRCRASLESDSPLEYYEQSEFRCDRALTTDTFDDMISKSTTCDYLDHIVINVDKASLSTKPNFPVSENELPPPIIAKHRKETKGTAWYKTSLVGYDSEDRNSITEQRTSQVRGIALNSPGIRLRINSKRMESRKVQTRGRKSISSSSSSKIRNLSDSFAIVKTSFDPHKDFRESMIEMIVENNIRATKDLEDLLACYLNLNSDEYHELIIKVFKQIWFDLTRNTSK